MEQETKVQQVQTDNKKNSTRRLLGQVSFVGDHYALVNTNQYLINESQNPAQPAQLYLKRDQWQGEAELSMGMWVSFLLKRQPKKERHDAINAKELSVTEEDYLLCQNYIDKYHLMEGMVMGRKVKALMTSPLYNTFYRSVEGRAFVLDRLYEEKNVDPQSWERLLSFMPEEEKKTFTIDKNFDVITIELRLLIYKHTKNIDYLKSQDIVNGLSKKEGSAKLTLNQLNTCFLTETDRKSWIEYVETLDQLTDELRALLFTMTDDDVWLMSIENLDAFAHALESSLSEVIKLVRYYIQSGYETSYKIISAIQPSVVVDALNQIGVEMSTIFLTRIPICDFGRYVSEMKMSKSVIKDNLRRTKVGRERLTEDLYLRKVNDTAEWDALLSTFDTEELATFAFDDKHLKPTAELRICLYRHLKAIDLLLHPSVVSFLSRQEDDKEIAVFVDNIKHVEDWDKWTKYVVESSIGNESLWLRLFLRKHNRNLYAAIQDKQKIVNYYREADATIMSEFLTFAFKDLSNDDLLSFFDASDFNKVVASLLLMPEDTCFQLIKKLPDELALRIVVSPTFKGSNVSKNYIGEKWLTLKSEVKYAVFDLELKGDKIDQFAFCAEDNLRPYKGEDQLKSLFRCLKKQPIIVGHNIKQFDLPILQKKGLELAEDKYIWDTLEIEILLNPCRYAYSLHTEHNAEADTRLTNDLFWNQLYRLSTEEGLVEQLRDVLPSNINIVLEALKIDYFADYFAETAGLDKQFFQELRPLSDATISHLNTIAQTPEDEETLIVAPQNLWARIAQYIPVSFPANREYNVVINPRIVAENPLDDIMKQTIIERFCSVSKTPLVRNLAQYLRVEGDNNQKITLGDDLLDEYKFEFGSHIDCIDVEGFECPEVLGKNYKHIYTIGTELDDRVHKCKACENKTFADLLACGSKLPFTMASTNYAPVKNKEIEKVGIKMPDLAANVWVERERNGQFAFYRNYQYQEYRKAFLSHFNVRPKRIEWNFKGSDYNNINLTQVSRNKSADRVMRVSTSTTQRSKYWLFQFALISKIHSAYPQMPIVYIVNEKNELEAITQYAEASGFYVPKYGTGFRKLEYIGSHEHGMVIISKQEFINESTLKSPGLY